MAFSVVGLVTLILAVLVEFPLLQFIGKGKLAPEALTAAISYYRWQVAGIVIFGLSHPLSTYLGARTSLKKLSVEVYLPWFLFSALIYAAAARQGALAAAQSNVLVYGAVFALLIFRFVKNRR